MSIVASRLDRLEDVQDKLISTDSMVIDRISNVEATADEKITMCVDGCAEQGVQQSQAISRNVENILSATMERALESMGFALTTRAEKLDFDEYECLQKFGHEQVQRKKHKPR